MARYTIQEMSEIIGRFKVLTSTYHMSVKEAVTQLSTEFGRTYHSIYAMLQRFRPTVDGAEAYLKANALRLAMRVARNANAAESMDILTRSNIGVLAPKTDGGGSNQGFFLSVKAENCGAVTIGAAPASPQTFASLPQPLNVIEGSRVDEGGCEIPPSTPLHGASGLPDSQERDQWIEAQPSEPVPLDRTLPGVPHPGQGHINGFDKPRDQWNPDHKRAVEVAKDKLKRLRQRQLADAKRAEMEGPDQP